MDGDVGDGTRRECGFSGAVSELGDVRTWGIIRRATVKRPAAARDT